MSLSFLGPFFISSEFFFYIYSLDLKVFAFETFSFWYFLLLKLFASETFCFWNFLLLKLSAPENFCSWKFSVSQTLHFFSAKNRYSKIQKADYEGVKCTHIHAGIDVVPDFDVHFEGLSNPQARRQVEVDLQGPENFDVGRRWESQTGSGRCQYPKGPLSGLLRPGNRQARWRNFRSEKEKFLSPTPSQGSKIKYKSYRWIRK